MASSRNRTASLLSCMVLWGCSVGSGEGEVQGTVNAPSCELDMADYDLDPTFFGADPVEELLEIRIQRGSDLEAYSDGLGILVRDAKRVRAELIGIPIELTGEADALVQMSFYLNETCPPDRRTGPVHYEAVAGLIVFENIYAPTLTEDDVETAARFNDVSFVDPESPDERHARLSGRFRFLYTRGRPAQRFP